MSTLFFRILLGISPILVAFLEDQFNISFLTSFLACNVLKFAFTHQFFHNQERFSKRIKSNINKV